MVSKSDDMSHDPFSKIKHPKTPSLPRLDDINDTAFALSQRVADEEGNLVRPEGYPEVVENPADVAFPKETEEEPDLDAESDGVTYEETVENEPAPSQELSVEEQLNFNLAEEENK